MRYITHEAVLALSANYNPFASEEAVAMLHNAVETLRPQEQKAITKHFLVKSCEADCGHDVSGKGNVLNEALKSLSHYYPTGSMPPSDLR